ncbi:MAG: hypothetical protein ACK482_13135 [Aphanizomenon sp.]
MKRPNPPTPVPTREGGVNLAPFSLQERGWGRGQYRFLGMWLWSAIALPFDIIIKIDLIH